jgi:hypothetical protein
MISVNFNMGLYEAELGLRRHLCNDLADLVLQFLQPKVEAWDPWAQWEHVPEYDACGNYGHLPMCAVELPMF